MDEKMQIEELSEFFYRVDGTTYRGGPIRVANYDALALALYDEGYRKQSGWISVDERLPEEHGRFLLIDDEGYMFTASWCGDSGWFMPICHGNAITHWDATARAAQHERRCGMINSRHIEVWQIEHESEIEETVNEYCRVWGVVPISISVTYSQRKDLWVVALVVEPKGGE